MSNLTMIDFQIFPSQYEQDGNGNKCCWLGGRDSSNNAGVSLQPYQTDAISGNSNPEWAFHLLATGQSDQYNLKYAKMSEPLKYWYGVSVDGGKLILKKWELDTVFIVKKIGEYYTVEYGGKHAECENGNLGKDTSIDLWDIKPPTPQQVSVYSNIPTGSFRVLWKFIRMDHMSGRDWFTKLSATRSLTDKLDRLFIPGTHDSGTQKNTQWLKTQYHTIAEQAAMGVRYFDLRVANNWEIYHSGSYSSIYLNYVVDTVVDHLTVHAGEFFFIQITAETPVGFSARLFDYLKANCPGVFPYVYLPDTIPTLKDAAKKIFFFARYQPAAHSDPAYPFKEHQIDWTDDTGGSNATNSPFATPQVYVQDRYKLVGDSNKFDNYITPTLYNKMFNRASDWTINFTSVSNVSYPLDAAWYINSWVANLLMWAAPLPCGILMIDGAETGNVANIIALNFD